MHGYYVPRIQGHLNLIYKDLVHILYLIIGCAPEDVETRCHQEVNERYYLDIFCSESIKGSAKTNGQLQR